MTVNLIIGTLAVLVLLEGLIITLAPKSSGKFFMKIAKQQATLRWLGMLELVFGALLLILAVSIRLN